MVAGNRINLVVAHSAEAKPLCAMLNLRALAVRSPFPVFHNDAGVSLVVSGMGKVASAAATAYLAGLQATQPACAWLNIGIAGHQLAAIGAGLLAHKVTDAATGRSFYPPQLVHGVATSALISVDSPEHDYPQNAAYDMEAAGFYASASTFATSELVHVFKVISDNKQQPLARFEISQVAGLITAQKQQLECLLANLDKLLEVYRAAYALPDAFSVLLDKYQFTASQRVQLRRYCERFRALKLDADLQVLSDMSFSSSKKLLGELEAFISHRASS